MARPGSNLGLNYWRPCNEETCQHKQKFPLRSVMPSDMCSSSLLPRIPRYFCSFWTWKIVFFSSCNSLDPLMSCTTERTPFKWGKGMGDKCCPGPESCLTWVSQGTEAGWHVPMPSSRRGGSKGKWMCPPFLTQARQPRHHFSVGLKGCRH